MSPKFDELLPSCSGDSHPVAYRLHPTRTLKADKRHSKWKKSSQITSDQNLISLEIFDDNTIVTARALLYCNCFSTLTHTILPYSYYTLLRPGAKKSTVMEPHGKKEGGKDANNMTEKLAKLVSSRI